MDIKKAENILARSAELIQNENEEAQRLIEEKKDKLLSVAMKIDKILIEEELTWGEWGTIVEMFSNRIGQFVAQTKITD